MMNNRRSWRPPLRKHHKNSSKPNLKTHIFSGGLYDEKNCEMFSKRRQVLQDSIHHIIGGCLWFSPDAALGRVLVLIGVRAMILTPTPRLISRIYSI